MTDRDKALLVLEDGSKFAGQSMGAPGEWVGEVVFNTSMTGYQEIITDPSYWGQMVAFTCPHIGNVGINLEDVESGRAYVRAVLARQICDRPSNWRSERSLPDYLREGGVPALSGIDVRRLTLLLREKGVMRGALSTIDLDPGRLHRMALSSADMSTLSPWDEVTGDGVHPWAETIRDMWVGNAALEPSRGRAPHVVVLDCGIKRNIMRHLVRLGARVTALPWDATSDEILSQSPDGVLVSNGPGDPRNVPCEVLSNLRALFGQVPVFGICLGHQILALATGAHIYKLPFGHHGGNHPVQDLATGRVEITAQNHNYAVEPASLVGLPLQVTHTNLYDGTIEGLLHREMAVSCVQYHPEASPGPHDSLYILRRFLASLQPR